jgi:hypothetical protein
MAEEDGIKAGTGWSPFKPVEALGEVTRGERQLVTGIPAVAMPVGIRGGEWACLGCGGVITEDNEKITWNHDAGCSVIADVAKAVRHAGA